MKTSRLLPFLVISIVLVSNTIAMRPLAPMAPLGATITVNTTTDEYGGGSGCSLREAVQSANDNTNFGGCIGSGLYGHDTIHLGTGTYPILSVNPSFRYEDNNVYGDLDIEPDPVIDLNIYDVTISGNGPENSIISGDYLDRLIDIQAGAAVKLEGLEIRFGAPGIQDGKSGKGGGIFNHGTLWIEDSRLYNNSSPPNTIPGGPHTSDGGAIWSDGKLTIINSTLSTNFAGSAGNEQNGGDGGGLFIAAGSDTVNITDSTFTFNYSGGTFDTATAGNGGRGAGIFNAGADTHVDGSTFYMNNAGNAESSTGDGGDGGGIYNDQGTITITNSTFFYNISGKSDFATSGDGAGLVNYGGLMELHESTVTMNRIEVGVSYGSGGGIESAADNTHTILHNTYLSWNNRYNAPPEDSQTDCHTGAAGSNVFDGRYSMIYTMDDCALDVSESMIIGIAPLMGAFGYHGGTTQTVPLNPNSRGIDEGDPADCPATDQRGYPRPVDGDHNGTALCDIGAYEKQLSIYLPLIIK